MSAGFGTVTALASVRTLSAFMLPGDGPFVNRMALANWPIGGAQAHIVKSPLAYASQRLRVPGGFSMLGVRIDKDFILISWTGA